MSYVEKILLPDERVLCITTIHWVIYSEGLMITAFGGLAPGAGTAARKSSTSRARRCCAPG